MSNVRFLQPAPRACICQPNHRQRNQQPEQCSMEKFLDLLIEHETAVLGSILGASFIAYLAWRNNRKTRHAAACDKFRYAVHSALAGLYPSPIAWPSRQYAIIEELESRFVAIESAVSEFKYYLSPWRRLLFMRAWCLYRLGNAWRGIDGQGQNYWQYVGIKTEAASFGIRKTHDNTLTYKANFKHNVGRLLSYARET